MSTEDTKRPFLSGQRIKILTGVKPKDLHDHIFGTDAKRAPSERAREAERTRDFWRPIGSREELCRDASLALPPMKRVGLVCDAGLGKTTNMEWLEAKIAGQAGGRQLPYLLKLLDSRQKRRDLELLEEEADNPGAILDELASRIAHETHQDKGRLLPALRRYQQEGRITLLIDGLDHALSHGNIAGTLRRVVIESACWRACPIWISGRPYAFEECWEQLFQERRPHDWHFLRVEPLPQHQIVRYMTSQAGGDWSKVFDAAAWNLLAIPRFLLIICDLIRREIAEAKSNAEKQEIVRGLDLSTAAAVYYRAYFDSRYHLERNKRGLLGQGADTLNDHDIAIASYKKESLNEFNYRNRIERAGVRLGAIAFELFSRNSDSKELEPTTSAIDVASLLKPVASRLSAAKQGDGDDFECDLDILKRMNNFTLDFLLFREAGSRRFHFYDRTVQAFFAAYWAMNHSTASDRKHLKNWIVHSGGGRLEGFQEFWQFAAGMPDAALLRDNKLETARWLEVFTPCYGLPKALAKKPEAEVQWCREMIHHSYNGMEQRSLATIDHWRALWLKMERGIGTKKQQVIYQAIQGGFRRCPKDETMIGPQSYLMGSPPREEGRVDNEEQHLVEVEPFEMHVLP